MKQAEMRGWLLPAVAITAVVAAASEPLQLALQSGDGRLVLVQDDDALRVEQDGTVVARRPPDMGLRWTTIASLRHGWVAAGARASDGGTGLTLLAGAIGGFRGEPARPLPPPPVGGRLARDPALLVDGGRLVGLAWLEGGDHRTLEVRAAPWEVAGWGTVERVAGRAAGSQMALSGAVLEDGSWLVVWAAYDGGDTEILWSRRTRGAWSEPARLHEDNEVHDIVPTVASTPEGALAAWSRFDGNDYRLRVARFDGSRWWPTPFVGGRGSLQPSLVSQGQTMHLLHERVDRSGWAVAELTGDGRLRRLAVVPDSPTTRPILVPAGDAGVVLRWPSADAEPFERQADWEPRP